MAADVPEVLGHLHPDVVVGGEQLQQFEPGEVEVVVLAAAHQVGVDASLHDAVSEYSTSCQVSDPRRVRSAERAMTGRGDATMERFDVVVLGTGAAGLTAAIAAHEGGASVAVFEKADLVGGTTAWSGGQVWIPNNPHMGEVGVTDSREQGDHVHHVAVARHARAAPRRGLRRRRARRWSSCSRPRRRCSSTPCPACPTTTRSSPAAAPVAAGRSSARSTRSTSSASGPPG